MFYELEITPQRALKVCIIEQQTLDPFTGFSRMHQDKLRQNPNESYHTASQKKKLKKKKLSQWTNKTIYCEIKENASSAERQKGPSSLDLC